MGRDHLLAIDWIMRAALDPMLRAVVSLGVTQIIAWGTTLYSLGVLGRPISFESCRESSNSAPFAAATSHPAIAFARLSGSPKLTSSLAYSSGARSRYGMFFPVWRDTSAERSLSVHASSPASSYVLPTCPLPATAATAPSA